MNRTELSCQDIFCAYRLLFRQDTFSFLRFDSDIQQNVLLLYYFLSILTMCVLFLERGGAGESEVQ